MLKFKDLPGWTRRGLMHGRHDWRPSAISALWRCSTARLHRQRFHLVDLVTTPNPPRLDFIRFLHATKPFDLGRIQPPMRWRTVELPLGWNLSLRAHNHVTSQILPCLDCGFIDGTSRFVRGRSALFQLSRGLLVYKWSLIPVLVRTIKQVLIAFHTAAHSLFSLSEYRLLPARRSIHSFNHQHQNLSESQITESLIMYTSALVTIILSATSVLGLALPASDMSLIDRGNRIVNPAAVTGTTCTARGTAIGDHDINVRPTIFLM